MEKKEINNLKISFSVGAFDKQMERSGIHDRKKFTRRIEKMNKNVEVLDRYDDFSSMMLASSDFAKKKGGKYGIEKRAFHFGANGVLLEHQQRAALAFLKDLRGFGLLADVVGSGKTYEACAILSELSAKGKITSMLLVVPAQVYNTWIFVLEKEFGLGEGVLKTVGSRVEDVEIFERKEDGLYHPKYPLIVKAEDFAKWRESDLTDVLFDVVVVDEAHNLCAEEGEYAKALKLLSVLMQTKKRARKTYCLMLSATPHSGNLASMFRLWYFSRCKGGNPSDFDELEDCARSENYNKEKAYYKEHICRGADTVMDFIKNVRSAEVTENYYEEFNAFLSDKGVGEYDLLLDAEKRKLIEEFLNLKDNAEIKNDVMQRISNAYHNGVLRSIMIRQPNDNIRKSKSIVNVMFFPLKSQPSVIELKAFNQRISLNLSDMYGEKAITAVDGEKYSISEFVEAFKGNRSYSKANAELFMDNGVFSAVSLTEDDFSKRNSLGFYWELLKDVGNSGVLRSTVSQKDVTTEFRPFYNQSELDFKFKELENILNKHKNERVIIFFDYDVKKSERLFDGVIERLKADGKYSSRILIGDGVDKAKTELEFNEKEDALLVVTDPAFTEGANLQKSSVIVNFQVTPNPLAMEQRIGRIFRLGQERDVTIYSLADMRKLEGYVLTYFTYIGLMNSNSGDAAIIAGSNNDNMVTIRCEACGKVKLLSREDYEEYLKKAKEGDIGGDFIYCNEDARCCQNNPRGTLMTEINSTESKCDNCGNLIRRTNSDDGGQFYCMSVNSTGSGVMCNTGDNKDRQLYCRKICCISHCERFTSGALKDKCGALNLYKENPNVSEIDLIYMCEGCAYKSLCPEKCRVGLGASSIKGCEACEYATCSPKPHVIDFDDKWEADCPVCAARGASGRLRPVVARTFETYIRSAFDYQQDGGRSFCDNLIKESNKVSVIQQILSNDKVGN